MLDYLKNGILPELLTQFTNAVPKFLVALVIFLIGWVIAKVIARLISNLFGKIGVDRVGEQLNEIDFIRNSNVKIKISAIFSKIVYYTLLLFFLVAAVDVVGMESLSNLVRDLINYIPKLVTALVLLLVGALIANALSSIVKTTCASLGIPAAGIIGSMVFWLLFITIGVSALSQAGIDTDFIRSNVTVILGGIVFAFAIGYGLASRSTVENFLASFYSKNKFQIGDTISIEEIKGVITEIDNTSFTIENGNSKIIFPLSKLTTEKVEVFHPVN